MREFKLLACLLLVLAVPVMVACNAGQNIRDFTPKQQLLMAMQVYNAQYDDYLMQAARADLSEQQRAALQVKKEALVNLHGAIAVYDSYISTGMIPPTEVIRLLDLAMYAVLDLI